MKMLTLVRRILRQKRINAQWRLVDARGVPMFAPSNGHCYKCGKDIVNHKWAKELITGCPKCGYSFTD